MDAKVQHIEYVVSWMPKERQPAARYFLGMGFETRAVNCFLNNSINSIDDLTKLSGEDLLKWPNFGRVTLGKVEGVLIRHGFKLRDEAETGDAQLAELIKTANATRDALRKAGEDHKAALVAVNRRRMEIGHGP